MLVSIFNITHYKFFFRSFSFLSRVCVYCLANRQRIGAMSLPLWTRRNSSTQRLSTSNNKQTKYFCAECLFLLDTMNIHTLTNLFTFFSPVLGLFSVVRYERKRNILLLFFLLLSLCECDKYEKFRCRWSCTVTISNQLKRNEIRVWLIIAKYVLKLIASQT